MNFKKSKLKILKYQKYHDAKISISFLDRKKDYPIHKILFASLFEFFEKLFDYNSLQENNYSIILPFQSQIFDIVYDKIYFGQKCSSDQPKFNKDINYYENILYLLSYLQYIDIKNYINKIIEFIEINYEKIDISGTIINQSQIEHFISTLQKMDLMEHTLKEKFIHRISYDKFIQNHYDKEKKQLVLTTHIYFDCFPNVEIDVNGVRFSLYHTNPYDIDQLGFWIDYEIISEKTSPMIGTGTLLIYSGINIYKHKIKNYNNFKDGSRLVFNSNGRYGYIIEKAKNKYNKNYINNFITFYQIIIDFEN